MSQITLDRLENLGEYMPVDERVFLVTGRRSYETSGARSVLDQVLNHSGVVRFSEFEINPKLDDIQRGIELFKDSGAETILAVGGGSVIDVAKSIRILSSQKSTEYERMVRENSAKEGLTGRFIAAPTTAGTGSEATHFAVVYVDGTKFSLSHPDAVADIVVLDPSLTAGLPPQITAATGMDAIAQATEAYWSVNSTEESRNYSREALALLLPSIVPVVKEATEGDRAAMLKGANLAGKAINIAQTTACHAISYPITSRFGVPHGHAVALTLPSFMEFNSGVTEADVQDKRGVEFVKKRMTELFRIYGVESSTQARTKLESIMDETRLERSLGKLGIDKGGVKFIVDNGFNPQRMKNNPRRLQEKQLLELLSSL